MEKDIQTMQQKRPEDFDITMEEGRRSDRNGVSLSERRKLAEESLLKSGQTRVRDDSELLG